MAFTNEQRERVKQWKRKGFMVISQTAIGEGKYSFILMRKDVPIFQVSLDPTGAVDLQETVKYWREDYRGIH